MGCSEIHILLQSYLLSDVSTPISGISEDTSYYVFFLSRAIPESKGVGFGIYKLLDPDAMIFYFITLPPTIIFISILRPFQNV